MFSERPRKQRVRRPLPFTTLVAEGRCALVADRRLPDGGRDKRGRRGSVAIPPNEPLRENVGNMCQHVANYDKPWQRVLTVKKRNHTAKCGGLVECEQHMGTLCGSNDIYQYMISIYIYIYIYREREI